jgi:hypothetical protein
VERFTNRRGKPSHHFLGHGRSDEGGRRLESSVTQIDPYLGGVPIPGIYVILEHLLHDREGSIAAAENWRRDQKPKTYRGGSIVHPNNVIAQRNPSVNLAEGALLRARYERYARDHGNTFEFPAHTEMQPGHQLG